MQPIPCFEISWLPNPGSLFSGVASFTAVTGSRGPHSHNSQIIGSLYQNAAAALSNNPEPCDFPSKRSPSSPLGTQAQLQVGTGSRDILTSGFLAFTFTAASENFIGSRAAPYFIVYSSFRRGQVLTKNVNSYFHIFSEHAV